jgi:hypothetical protein
MLSFIFKICRYCRFLSILFLSFFLLGCGGPASIKDNLYLDRSVHQINQFTYFLAFDNNGRFTSHRELNRAIEDLSKDDDGKKINKIVILSLGWGHDRDELVQAYEKLLANYAWWKTRNGKREKEGFAVFCLLWESSLASAGNLFADILPIPNALISLLSTPLQPITYWSKARLADKIGFGDLKEVIDELETGIDSERNQIIPKYCDKLKETQDKSLKRYNCKPLEMYFIAHSFGSRIVTSLLTDPISRPNDSDASAETTDENKNGYSSISFLKGPDIVKGVLLIQPALSSYEIERINIGKLKYPLMVTESRHDHLNRLLFPMANLPLNSANFRMVEEFKNEVISTCPNKIIDLCRSRTYSDGLDYYMIPFHFPLSALSIAMYYPYGQVVEMGNRGWRYIPDTLEQMPLVEIPVEWINNKVYTSKDAEDNNYWGHLHKGLFNFGLFHESAATYIDGHVPLSQAKVMEMVPLQEGILPIDMSEEINQGVYGENLSANPPLADWTIG